MTVTDRYLLVCMSLQCSASRFLPGFASGGDDYFLILLVESCKVRAIASPAAALAALAAAIVALCTRCALLCARSHVPFAHGPHRLWTVASRTRLLAAGGAAGKWQIRKWPFATV